ncbi:hypothetical protein TRFO_31654 [Tritrichomonas foetus]|uniref:UV excision repair protein RAD23 n=1 Tax=Tritrichomonas foetus TaxID=1144522 RepID=A0A1J4JQV8_9EUKA|nr:hypothetical protein TRFO_31654 [Tritrichomonas foetus]|eukprot:OHT01505.1 hypothetical protein TRFO_31654 [Tritrichomonas foetus]
MKLIVQKVKESGIEIEVDPKATIEDARDILIKKHNFPQGQYTFIFKGQILKNPEPFSSLKEKSRLIVYIKEIKQQPAQQQTAQPNPQTQSQPTAQNPAQGSGPQANQQQNPQMNQQMNPQLNQQLHQRQQQMIEQTTNVVRSAFDLTMMSQVYNQQNNFWNHQSETAQVAQLLENPSNIDIALEFLQEHFSSTFHHINVYPHTILDIIGSPHNTHPVIIIPDDRAFVESLPNEQRSALKRLLNLGFDEETTIQTFKACDMNEEQTANCLASMGLK